MPRSTDRRSHPRLASFVRIQWYVAGKGDTQTDRLRDVSDTGALVMTEAVARTGDEIRFDLLDDTGDKIAAGLALVVRVDAIAGRMGIQFLAVGIDASVVASLKASDPARPPPLPGKVGGPPPLPGEHILAARAAAEALPAPEEDEAEPQIEPLNAVTAKLIIGIDLGTTNTCASYVVDGRPQIIPGRTGTNTIPSMITFDPDGKWHVGQRAADRQILYPLRTVYGSKRLVGRTYRDEVAAELQKHFAYPLAKAEGQRFGVRIDDRVISMDAIAARVLEEVRDTAEAFLKTKVEAAVITVPAYFSEVQREAVRRAAKDANLTVHRIVNEPTAAAVAYGHKQKGKKTRVAVWDFGGGTFDFSIVNLGEDELEVLATGGDNFVGGADFDDLLASHILAEFQREAGLDVDPDPQQIARLRAGAELAKRALSVQTEYVVELPEFTREPRRALSVEVTRQQFDQMTRPLIDRTLTIAREVMQGIGLSPETDVDDVLLVGGTTRIPAVQKAVGDLFKRRPSKRINPDEAVALGAALLAAEIGSGAGPTLLDILPMSVGYGAAGLRFVPIVEKNSRLPAERVVTLDADILGSVSLPIFQGESSDASRNEYLCSAVVEDTSLWEKGRVTVRISFDDHCVMAIEARNARTGRALPLRLDRTKPVEEILRELGKYDGPQMEPTWQLPSSKLGRVLGKLFGLFRK